MLEHWSRRSSASACVHGRIALLQAGVTARARRLGRAVLTGVLCCVERILRGLRVVLGMRARPGVAEDRGGLKDSVLGLAVRDLEIRCHADHLVDRLL